MNSRLAPMATDKPTSVVKYSDSRDDRGDKKVTIETGSDNHAKNKVTSFLMVTSPAIKLAARWRHKRKLNKAEAQRRRSFVRVSNRSGGGGGGPRGGAVWSY